MRKELIAYWGFLSFSILGVTVFILLPFANVVRRSFVTTMSNQYIGLTKYKKVVENEAFVLAVKNTLHFICIAIPLLVVIGLVIAFVLSKMKDNSVTKALYFFPMAMPTATVVIVWSQLVSVFFLCKTTLSPWKSVHHSNFGDFKFL